MDARAERNLLRAVARFEKRLGPEAHRSVGSKEEVRGQQNIAHVLGIQERYLRDLLNPKKHDDFDASLAKIVERSETGRYKANLGLLGAWAFVRDMRHLERKQDAAVKREAKRRRSRGKEMKAQ